MIRRDNLRRVALCLLASLWLTLAAAPAQQPALQDQQQPLGQQPPPFTAPNPPTPPTANAPGQQAVPGEKQPEVPPDAPLPQPDKTTVDLRNLAPLSSQPAAPVSASANVLRNSADKAAPESEAVAARTIRRFDFTAPYRASHLPQFSVGSPTQPEGIVRDGKLFLSLHEAIVLAIQNNLDVEVSRYNLLLADTDVTRAKGGGNLRGLDLTIEETPPGVAAATVPLLITATTGNGSSTNAAVTDLSQVNRTGSGAQQSLSETGTLSYSAGPMIPLFDPTLTAQAAYFRRSDQISLISTGTDSGTNGSSSDSGNATAPLSFLSAGVDYQQGFSTGAQLDVYADNAALVLYAGNSQYDPFHAPSTSVTLTQPLLRGRGREVNLRFVRIARLDQKVSRLVFEQQLLETIYGVSRLYYDLVSLGENIGVKEESLAAAQKLFDDDKSQVDEGTLAPIELTRAQALLSSNRLDLIQAQAEYRQQEVILRQQLERTVGAASMGFASIVPTDRIEVPAEAPPLDVAALIQDALSKRPDLVQASLQVEAGEIAARAAGNNVKPLLNIYGNVQTRGSSLVPYESLGSPGTGVVNTPVALTQGGLRLSTIYQGGIQLNMPFRNRIAQADVERDAIQTRQARGRTEKLENDIRQQTENAAIALDNAHQAYAAAVESRNYQQQLLQAEIDKFSVGESTNYLIIQDEAYLAQARSTEVAARSDWMKARLSLDRALGDLLETNNIEFDDAVRERVK